MKSKPNIIFITFDSGRADRMGFLGCKKNLTPFLDSLAKDGVYFKRAFATGPGSSVSFSGIFTSTYPLDYGGYSYIDRPRVLLSEVFKGGGYTTVGIHSSPYLSSYFGYNRGWDEFHYLTYFGSKRKSGAETANHTKSDVKSDRGAGDVMSPGLCKGTVKANVLKSSALTYRWLKKYIPPLAILYAAGEKLLLLLRKILKDIVDFRPAFYTADEMNEEAKHVLSRVVGHTPQKPVFFWLHYLDAHGPYALFARKKGNTWQKIKYYFGDILAFLFADAPFLNRLIIPVLSGLYDESLRYIDKHIKQLLDYLDLIGINRDNSIFIFCADHGEAFLEHGAMGHSQRLFNPNIHIPLLFYGPRNLLQPQAVGKPVSLLDVSPTILSLAGLKNPDSYKGKNLFDEDGRARPNRHGSHGGREVISYASESEGDLSGAAFTGITIIKNGYKLIHWKDKRYLFSLDDTEERNNLYETKKEIVGDLEERLKNYIPHGYTKN